MSINLIESLRSLKQHYKPLDGIPEQRLLTLLRTYELDTDDSLTLNGNQEECLFVLDGKIACSSSGIGEQILEPTNTAAHPFCITGQINTFTALMPSLIGRLNPTRLDFLLSWQNLADELDSDDPVYRWMTAVNQPLVFRQLPLENARQVFSLLQPMQVKAGEEVIRTGEEADHFYLIEHGTAELWRQGIYDDEPQLTATLRAGDHFGEEALVMGSKRAATVRMIEDGLLLTLGKQDFSELINSTMVKRVSAKVAKAMIEDQFPLLDVRYGDEYELEHLADSTLIPLPELHARIGELDKTLSYVVYCHSGARSDVAALLLKQYGISAVSLMGGIRDWPYEIIK